MTLTNSLQQIVRDRKIVMRTRFPAESRHYDLTIHYDFYTRVRNGKNRRPLPLTATALRPYDFPPLSGTKKTQNPTVLTVGLSKLVRDNANRQECQLAPWRRARVLPSAKRIRVAKPRFCASAEFFIWCNVAVLREDTQHPLTGHFCGFARR